MKKRVSKGKKGAVNISWAKAAGVLLAGIVIFAMINFLANLQDNTFLEKNFVARDLGMMITTVQGSPGDVVYCYDVVGKYNDKFNYEIGNSRVAVIDQKNENVRAVHWYLEDKDDLIQEVSIKDEDAKVLRLIMIVKDENGVRIIPKKEGEDASPC
jgi:hypothetical protein